HPNDKQDVIAVLNNLIETCKDGENGFRAAADGVLNSELKSLFWSYAQQRARYAIELQSEVRRLGEDPENRGTLAAALHRGWINIKSVVSRQDEGAIISECERGEDSARSNYQDALQEDLPADVRALIERQFAGIKEAHSRLRALEVAASHA